jgi:menaquinol-cytochrome c reductase iron-sulfur subunit
VRDRRGILKTLTAALGGLVGAMVAIPAVRMLWHPVGWRAARGEAEPRPAARADQLAAGRPLRVTITGARTDAWLRLEQQKLGACWLVREGEQVRALSTVCPHLGCGIDWNDDHRTFECPCHGSVFDARGRRAAGPSPRDMDELEVVVANGEIFVRYQRFRVSAARKEPVG